MNRSEELCKLLGIEPNWVNIICKGLECKNKCNLFVLPSDKCRKIEKGEPCQYIYRYKEIYPDLTKPSNFVKLLEIIYKKWGWIEIKGDGVNNNFIEDFINISISNIKTGLEYIDKYPSIKTIIDIAQATKWDY